mgnify:CR=1 FL=1
MGRYIMALDQGTTSSRCILFDKKGNIISKSSKEYEQIYPKEGWVEHNPMEIWSSQLGVAIEAMAMVNVPADDIEAIGITNQRETTIIWDKKTGKPVYNAIVWQCRRTADSVEKIMHDDNMADIIKKKTGLIPDAYFSATKIAWILDNVDGAREKAENGELNLMQHISWKYDKLPHMLISGDTGSGKTIFLLIVIKALLESGAVLHICDPKKADLSFLSRIMPDVHYDTESIMECVEAFYEGMETRYDEMQEHPDFRMGANYAKVGLTPHFLIFDEYVAFMDTLAKKEWEEVMKLIRIIIMKGRQAGYFIILACQRPDAKYLGDGVRDQFGFRVALGSMSASGYTMMFGSIDKQFKEKDIAGRGYVNTGNGVVTEFYAPYVDPRYDFFTELSRIYEKRQQEGEACDRMYENGSETAGEE